MMIKPGAKTNEHVLLHFGAVDYVAVMQPLHDSPIVQGFCYTQLTDVEQEINGLLTYDRVPKLPVEQIKEIVHGHNRNNTD